MRVARQPVANGKSQMDVFWNVWAEKPNYICFALAVITIVESTFVFISSNPIQCSSFALAPLS